MAPVDVALDLDDVDVTVGVEGADVGPESVAKRRLAGNREQLHTYEGIQVRPEQIFDLLLV